MEILNNIYGFGSNRTKTNFKIPFELKSNYIFLKISFYYPPGYSNDKVAKAQLVEGLKKYKFSGVDSKGIDLEKYLLIENLVT